MKKVFSLLQVLVLVTIGSLAYAAEQPLAKPDVLGEEEVMTSQRLSTYDTIVIKDFSTEGVVLDRWAAFFVENCGKLNVISGDATGQRKPLASPVVKG